MLTEVLDHINLDPFKSVASPSAQTVTLCELNARQLYNQFLLCKLSEVEKLMGAKFRLLVDLIATNGCRISEVLAIQCSDIQFNGQVFIKGKKGSNNRFLSCLVSMPDLLAAMGKNGILFDGYSRFYVYREFKKLGLYFESQNSSRLSITHAFRHYYILELRRAGFCDADIAQVVGHKNTTNTANYGKQR